LPHSLEALDLFSPSDPGEDLIFLRVTFPWDDQRDVLTTASAEVYPNIFSAARFHQVIIPSRVSLYIASSEESMIAESSAVISSALGASDFKRRSSSKSLHAV
jgi:hypothetical protein